MGTGCKGDCASTWSADECVSEGGEKGHIAQSGASKCAKSFPATCTGNATAGVRCCADAAPEAATNYPEVVINAPLSRLNGKRRVLCHPTTDVGSRGIFVIRLCLLFWLLCFSACRVCPLQCPLTTVWAMATAALAHPLLNIRAGFTRAAKSRFASRAKRVKPMSTTSSALPIQYAILRAASESGARPGKTRASATPASWRAICTTTNVRLDGYMGMKVMEGGAGERMEKDRGAG
jgi:hypothetical protein